MWPPSNLWAPLDLWQLDNFQPHLNIFCWPHISAWYLFFFIITNFNFISNRRHPHLHIFVVSAFVAQFYVLCNIWNFLTHSDYFIHADVCSFAIWNSINIAFHADVWNFFNMSYFVSMLTYGISLTSLILCPCWRMEFP